MKSHIEEFWHSLKKNKLRTALTGFTISWGVIILVVVLGSGEGVKNGVIAMTQMFNSFQSVLSLTLSQTSKPYAGFQEGRTLQLSPSEFAYLREKHRDYVKAIEPSLSQSFRDASTNFGSTLVKFNTLTLTDMELSSLDVIKGRSFTLSEHTEGARVAIISENILSNLFAPNQDPIGAFITLDGLEYRVIGVVKTESPFFGSTTIPYQTYASIYPNEVINVRTIKVYPLQSDIAYTKAVEKEVLESLRQLLKVAPDDIGAIQVESGADIANVMNNIFMILNIFLWVMGIGSLSVGMVGVSNIIYVSVQERMREIGIRKAIGATSRDITLMVLGESLLLSLSSGIIGLMIGVGIVGALDYGSRINNWGTQTFPTGLGESVTFTIFVAPGVNLSAGIGAVIVIVLAGLIAGYGPAKKAVRIPAIVAMRDLK